jgi:hypothetical protein
MKAAIKTSDRFMTGGGELVWLENQKIEQGEIFFFWDGCFPVPGFLTFRLLIVEKDKGGF